MSAASGAIVLNQLDLVVHDIDTSVAFYRRLGVEIPDSAIWRTDSGAHHVDLHLPNGFTLHFDSVALARSFNRGWPETPGSGPRNILGFALSSREAVVGRQPPYDTFWGARDFVCAKRATPGAPVVPPGA